MPAQSPDVLGTDVTHRPAYVAERAVRDEVKVSQTLNLLHVCTFARDKHQRVETVNEGNHELFTCCDFLMQSTH